MVIKYKKQIEQYTLFFLIICVLYLFNAMEFKSIEIKDKVYSATLDTTTATWNGSTWVNPSGQIWDGSGWVSP